MEDIKCRVLNLDAYADRMTHIPAEMEKMGIKWERFRAIDPPEQPASAYIGSTYSHQEILRGAEGALLVCEDDVIFTDGAREVFDKAFSQLPEDWDMFYLGGNVKMPAERYSENLFRIKGGVHCNHAIFYSEKARDFILTNYNQFTDIGYYDHWLYVTGLGLMNCYICYPVIAYQMPCFSNARGAMMDYYGEMKENEKKHLI